MSQRRTHDKGEKDETICCVGDRRRHRNLWWDCRQHGWSLRRDQAGGHLLHERRRTAAGRSAAVLQGRRAGPGDREPEPGGTRARRSQLTLSTVPPDARPSGGTVAFAELRSAHAIRRGQRGPAVGDRARHLAVRVEGLGLRHRLRATTKPDAILAARARSRHQPDRHRRDLRARRIRTHRRPRARRAAAKKRSSRRRCCRSCRPRGTSRSTGATSARATRHRRDRPVPDPLAQPGRADRAADGGHAPAPGRRASSTDVGVSNFSLARWQAAEAALGSPVLSNQVQYSLVAAQARRRAGARTRRRTIGS